MTEDNLSPQPIQLKTGKEPFTNQNENLSFCLQDFWSWSQSDLLNNSLRGVLAEFIVKEALKVEMSYRTEWDAYDLQLANGLKIEVKSSAYLQSWRQKKHSSISFDIGPKQGWDAVTNEYTGIVKRQADFYIFCLLHHKDKTTVNPMDLNQWTFYILNTEVLNEKIPHQKRIALSALLKLKPLECDYSQLCEIILPLS